MKVLIFISIAAAAVILLFLGVLLRMLQISGPYDEWVAGRRRRHRG